MEEMKWRMIEEAQGGMARRVKKTRRSQAKSRKLLRRPGRAERVSGRPGKGRPQWTHTLFTAPTVRKATPTSELGPLRRREYGRGRIGVGINETRPIPKSHLQKLDGPEDRGLDG